MTAKDATTIQIKRDLLNRLASMKRYSRESYGEVIERIIQEAEARKHAARKKR